MTRNSANPIETVIANEVRQAVANVNKWAAAVEVADAMVAKRDAINALTDAEQPIRKPHVRHEVVISPRMAWAGKTRLKALQDCDEDRFRGGLYFEKNAREVYAIMETVRLAEDEERKATTRPASNDECAMCAPEACDRDACPHALPKPWTGNLPDGIWHVPDDL